MIDCLGLFSILITAYNREEYIAKAIESVLAQTFIDFELIVLDDCSSDNTYAIAYNYEQIDPRVKVYRNHSNMGQFANRNKIATLANNDFIIYLDSDDTFNSDALYYINSCLKQYPEINFGMIYNKQVKSREPFYLSASEAIKHHFFKQSILQIGPGGTVVRKKLFLNLGGFPVNYGPVGDMFYNIKITATEGVLLMPYDYLNYNLHEGQEINNHYSYLYNGYLYFNDILNLPSLPLNHEDKTYLRLKNKRRFVLNTFKYLFEHKDISKIIRAYKLTKFTFVDLFKAIFH